MRTLLLSGVALGLLTSVASAEPLKLNDQQLGETTAGVLGLGDVNVDVGVTNQIPTNVAGQIGVANALNLFSDGAAAATLSQILGQVGIGSTSDGNS
jgi:hypothetical protein